MFPVSRVLVLVFGVVLVLVANLAEPGPSRDWMVLALAAGLLVCVVVDGATYVKKQNKG